MTTVTTRETESTAVVAETLAAPAAATAPSAAPFAVPSAAAVDVSAVPETPGELLKQWDTARRPLLHTVIAATLIRIWDGLTGPGMTERERVNRAVAEHNGFARILGRNV